MKIFERTESKKRENTDRKKKEGKRERKGGVFLGRRDGREGRMGRERRKRLKGRSYVTKTWREERKT